MLIAIAIGRLYQTLSSTMSGVGAPNPEFNAMAANVTDSGTARASAYQTQLTRQRISRAPMAFRPATPSVTDTTISAATRTPGAKKLFQGTAPQLSAHASRKKMITRCRLTTDMTSLSVLGPVLTRVSRSQGRAGSPMGRTCRPWGGFLPRVQADVRLLPCADRLSDAGVRRLDLVRRWVTVGLDDQPGASVLIDVMAEDLVLAFVGVEVQRVAGVCDLCCAVVPPGRAEEVRPHTPFRLGLSVRSTGGQSSAQSPLHSGRVPRSASNR